jgi:hypothetical protein
MKIDLTDVFEMLLSIKLHTAMLQKIVGSSPGQHKMCLIFNVKVSAPQDISDAYGKGTKKTPWSEPTSEIYRPSDRRLSVSDCQLLRIEGATWSA